MVFFFLQNVENYVRFGDRYVSKAAIAKLAKKKITLFTAALMESVYSDEEMATRTLTGSKPRTTEMNVCTKPQLPEQTTNDLIGENMTFIHDI